MDNTYFTTEHKKCQHLTAEERHEIEVRLKDSWTIYKIAKHLQRPYNTIKNEIQRGTVSLYNGKVKRYKADEGYKVYLERRRESRRKYRWLAVSAFLQYVQEHFRTDKWSLDSCVGHALATGRFRRSEIVCTKTLYRYIDLGLLPITNMDLPEKLHRNTKRHEKRENRKNLGKSIDERPESIDLREEFGHWEIDSVLGKKGEREPAVVSLTERTYRVCIWLKVEDHSAEAVDKALRKLFLEFGDKYDKVFKTITADNGSEFANLSNIETKGVGIYFTHPYSSYEKGTVECHNRMLRRFIPKGKSINDYSADEIMIFADIINGLPRKSLNYHTPEELFEAELDKIYAV
jgi:IS30 family transposase